MSTHTFIALVVALVVFLFRRRPLIAAGVLGVLYLARNKIAAWMYRQAFPAVTPPASSQPGTSPLAPDAAPVNMAEQPSPVDTARLQSVRLSLQPVPDGYPSWTVYYEVNGWNTGVAGGLPNPGPAPAAALAATR